MKLENLGSNKEPIPVLDRGFVRLVEACGDDLLSRSQSCIARYLWANGHTGPFEAVTLTFEIKAPIFVFRQWQQQRTWLFNEPSERYKTLPVEFYVPTPEDAGTTGIIKKACETAVIVYNMLTDVGVPQEVAQIVLPLATYSRMFVTVSLLNLFRFLALREDDKSRLEIREYARSLKELARTIVPVAMSAFEESQ